MICRGTAECARTCCCLLAFICRLASVAGCQALPGAQEAGRASVNLFAISFLLCTICQAMSRTLSHLFFFSSQLEALTLLQADGKVVPRTDLREMSVTWVSQSGSFCLCSRSHGLCCGKFFERESCKTRCSNGIFLKGLTTVLSRIPVKPHPFESRIEGDIWGLCTFLHFPFPPRNVRQ